MAFEQIKYEIADNILTITLNRPDKMNAFTGVMQRELIEAFDKADADDAVRAIIVTGAGKAFCAAFGQIGSGAECLAGTRDDDRPYIVVGVGGIERRDQFSLHEIGRAHV